MGKLTNTILIYVCIYNFIYIYSYYQSIGTFLFELQQQPSPLQKPPEKSNVWVELEHKIIDV